VCPCVGEGERALALALCTCWVGGGVGGAVEKEYPSRGGVGVGGERSEKQRSAGDATRAVCVRD
jgi:hypothetical protein